MLLFLIEGVQKRQPTQAGVSFVKTYFPILPQAKCLNFPL